MGLRLKEALLAAAKEKGLPLQLPQTGSMFAFFFADQPVTNFTEVMASHTEHFKPFFHEAMKNGVYLPPSPYETCFISTAHSNGDMDRAIEILVAALKAI